MKQRRTGKLNVVLGENAEEERYRRPTRAKPIMIPVDQPPPPRERECAFLPTK